MNFPSVLSQVIRQSFSGRSRCGRRTRPFCGNPVACAVERVEERRLLAATGANDLAALSDEFDVDSTAQWLRINEVENWNADQLQTYDIDQTQAGRMVMAPDSVVWYQNWRGPMAFKEVTGDFVFTTQVHIGDRDDIGIADGDDVPDEAQFSLAGAMIRTPRNINNPAQDWQPGSMADDGTNNGENYVFLSLGHGTDGQFSFEVKTTRNSNSQLSLMPVDSNTATLQVARIGNTVLMMRQLPGQDWVVHERYSRPDMPETLQVGLVSYTDWQKASDYDPFYHNSNILSEADQNPTPDEPFNQDLVAGYEYARFVRPQVPAELAGVDLLNAATDEQLLSFLGGHADIPATVDPAPDLPVVSIAAVSNTIKESDGNVALFTISRIGMDSTEALTVNYQVAGTAQTGTDYKTLSETAVLPAGVSSVQVFVDLIDDALVEGAESIELHLVDEVFYDLGDPAASISIADNDFELVGDQVIPGNQDVLLIALPQTDPDGAALEYTAVIAGATEYSLDQQYDFYVQDSYYENWGGFHERWIRGDGGSWFYLLPAGTLNLWNGSFASSEQIAELGTSVYDDPARLVDVDLPAVVSVDGSELAIDPDHGFVGSFDVDVTVTNGQTHSTERITVTVEAVDNAAPEISAIADQVMSHSDIELRVPFAVNDADGDALTLTASVAQPEVYQLDQQFDFSSDGNYHDNWGGENERWVTANQGGSRWYYLLPDGQLLRWEGSFAESSLVASLGSSVYDDPSRLTDAEAITADVSIDQNQIVIVPEAGFVGQFNIVLTADDGLETVSAEFSVDVTNAAPVFLPVGDLVIVNADGTLMTELTATDADDDSLVWTAEVVNSEAWQLDADLDLQTSADFYTNWGGHNEKWLRSSSLDWYFILPNGEFHRWTGSFESSELMATLSESYYADPNRIADPQSVPVEVSITGNMLLIDAADDFADDFLLRVTVFDGQYSVSQLINVTIGL